ncbi:MAG: serine hydrolase domain-containing protein, partial [Actinomycetes bacterium]
MTNSTATSGTGTSGSATTPSVNTDDLQRRLDAALAATGVPGAALAVGVGDELVEVASGVLHSGTGAVATPDSWFQIGSVTKVLTATLVMQLVDSGAVQLDDTVQKHLPGFALADPGAAK